MSSTDPAKHSESVGGRVSPSIGGPAAGPLVATPPRRRFPLVVLVVLVVAVVVVAAVLFVARPKSSTTGPTNSSRTLTFGEARSVAERGEAAFQGGNRSLVYAVGFGTSVRTVLPPGALVNPDGVFPIGAGCSVTVLSPNNTTFPAFDGDWSTGAVPVWQMLYRNATGGNLLDVIDGVASVVATLSGSFCGSSLGRLTPLSSNTTDSPAVLGALSSYAAPFHSVAKNTMDIYYLLPAGSLQTPDAPAWSIEISDCGPIHSAFTGRVNASSGVVVGAQTGVGWECGLPSNRSLRSATSNLLDMDFPYEIANTSSYSESRLNITFVNGTITWAGLSALLEQSNPFGVATENPFALLLPLTSGWTLTALDPSNATLATYDPASWTWSGGGARPIVAGDQLEIRLISSVRDGGYASPLVFSLGGTGAFWGNPMMTNPSLATLGSA